MQKPLETTPPPPRRARWPLLLLALLLAGAGFYLVRRGNPAATTGTTFTARRGPLAITVVEGGSVQAQESQEIKCEVRVGYQGLKILKIVEEGYLVTDEDVKSGKVLVELDSSELRKQLTQQDISFESTAASLVDAQQAYDIQLNQNLSDVKAAEQKARFARLDLDKFVGTKATEDILQQLGITSDEIPPDTNAPPSQLILGQDTEPAPSTQPAGVPQGAAVMVVGGGAGQAVPGGARIVMMTSTEAGPGSPPSTPPPNAPPPPAPVSSAAKNSAASMAQQPSIVIDFSKYANVEALGDGEAKQKIRKFDDDLQVARKEMGQARNTLEGTQRLFDKGFVSKTEKERDEIAHENSRLKVQTAETARDLYLRYDFVKSSEETLSKYLEARRELDRARRAAVSRLAQAEAKLKSAQGRYNLEARQRKELIEQLDKCIIKASKTGLVVYGGGGEEMYWGGEERIREGATIRERQSIITIPDTTKMSVKVRIHESYIKKIKKGLKARVTVDAFADKVLTGEVSKVGVLPDSQNRWMNPDLKVYLTTITVEGVHDWIKPGMSAKVEVMVNQLDNVIYVPVQAVTPINGKQYCQVVKGAKSDRREVEIGEFNDEFIEVKQGIQEGDVVVLRAVEPLPGEGKDKQEGGKPEDQAKPAAAPAPAGAVVVPAG
jgi:multidrug resistance efflux pump